MASLTTLLILLVAAFFSVVSCENNSFVDEARRSLAGTSFPYGKIQVIVIGAGMAGTRVASVLARQTFGYKYSITILEARNRFGGRINTRYGKIKNGKTYGPVEMGAQWIQNYVGNPLYEQSVRLSSAITDDNSDELYYYQNGTAWSADDVTSSADAYDELLDKATTYAADASKDVSMDVAMKAVSPTDYANPDIQWQIAEQICDEYAAPLRLFSGRYGSSDEQFGAGFKFYSKGFYQVPYHTLNEALVTNNARILYNQVVKRIDYKSLTEEEATGKFLKATPLPRVKVTTTAGKVYYGHVVVVTVPIGVLKAKSINFVPPLSSVRQSAIRGIGAGHLNKVGLFFDKLYWPANVAYFGVQDKNRGLFPHFVCLYPLWKIPMILGACNDQVSDFVDTTTDAKAVALALAKLRTFIPALKNVQPVDAWISRWGSDPYTLGAYSFAQVGIAGDAATGSASDFDNMAEPEWPLLYAGEATTNYWGSVHGALISGNREGLRIISATA